MSLRLSTAVIEHLARVRENPASAVDPAQLEVLERLVRQDLDDYSVALNSPIANFTWMSRVALPSASDESNVDTIEDFGEPVEIVGLFPLILQLTDGGTTPIEAIDVQITTDTGRKEFVTAANTPVSGAQQRPQYSPLVAVSAAIANRSICLRLGEENTKPTMAFQYRWAVDSATRTTLGYGDVLVSVGVFYRLMRRYSRRRGGR